MTEPTELHLFGEDDDSELAPTPGRRRGRVRSPRGPASPGHYATYGDGKGLLFGKIAGSFWFRRNRPDRNQQKLDLK